jgi:hypothetical protein
MSCFSSVVKLIKLTLSELSLCVSISFSLSVRFNISHTLHSNLSLANHKYLIKKIGTSNQSLFNLSIILIESVRIINENIIHINTSQVCNTLSIETATDNKAKYTKSLIAPFINFVKLNSH